MNTMQSLPGLSEISLLYVEDDALIREMLVHFLRRRVGRLHVAVDGAQGLTAFRTYKPDMVLTDIQMPEMDGLTMAKQIRAENMDVPIIFSTAYNDTEFLLDAIDSHADGYVLKPVDLDVLMQCLLKNGALVLQRRELMISRAQLSTYHRKTAEERQLVANLMAKMMREERLHHDRFQYWLQPTEVVGGDLVACAQCSHGRLYVMLADSTGHGLPAALNLLPINHIFYSMVDKGLPVTLIVEEMNWAVKEQSPIERYVAAIVASVDFDNRVIEVWNGGIPGAHFISENGTVAHTFDSAALPLGLLERTFSARTEMYQWIDDGHLFIYSDGLADAENEAGTPFSTERIVAALKQTMGAERLNAVRDQVMEHLAGRSAHDDMTAALIDCRATCTR